MLPELARALEKYLGFLRRRWELSANIPLFLSRENNADGTARALSREAARLVIHRAFACAKIENDGRLVSHNRRPDVVVFVNGLPLALIELKNAADEDADIWTAYEQLRTYKAEIPSLLQYNAALVVSGGRYARIGSLTANQEWFNIWPLVVIK